MFFLKYSKFYIRFLFLVFFVNAPISVISYLFSIISTYDLNLRRQYLISLSIFLIQLLVVAIIHLFFRKMNKYMAIFISIVMCLSNVFFEEILQSGKTYGKIYYFFIYILVISYYLLRYGIKNMNNYFKKIDSVKIEEN